jgi:hypothetical protein
MAAGANADLQRAVFQQSLQEGHGALAALAVLDYMLDLTD